MKGNVKSWSWTWQANTHSSCTCFSLPANLASSSIASSRQTVESTSKQTQSADRQRMRAKVSLLLLKSIALVRWRQVIGWARTSFSCWMGLGFELQVVRSVDRRVDRKVDLRVDLNVDLKGLQLSWRDGRLELKWRLEFEWMRCSPLRRWKIRRLRTNVNAFSTSLTLNSVDATLALNADFIRLLPHIASPERSRTRVRAACSSRTAAWFGPLVCADAMRASCVLVCCLRSCNGGRRNVVQWFSSPQERML